MRVPDEVFQRSLLSPLSLRNPIPIVVDVRVRVDATEVQHRVHFGSQSDPFVQGNAAQFVLKQSDIIFARACEQSVTLDGIGTHVTKVEMMIYTLARQILVHILSFYVIQERVSVCETQLRLGIPFAHVQVVKLVHGPLGLLEHAEAHIEWPVEQHLFHCGLNDHKSRADDAAAYVARFAHVAQRRFARPDDMHVDSVFQIFLALPIDAIDHQFKKIFTEFVRAVAAHMRIKIHVRTHPHALLKRQHAMDVAISQLLGIGRRAWRVIGRAGGRALSPAPSKNGDYDSASYNSASGTDSAPRG